MIIWVRIQPGKNGFNLRKRILYIHTYILNWPLPIGAFQGQCNTTKQRNRTTTTVKNPNWPEANQLAIYKCSWEVESGTTRNKFNVWSERVLNPGSPDLKASALTTRPHCLAICIYYPRSVLMWRRCRVSPSKCLVLAVSSIKWRASLDLALTAHLSLSLMSWQR